MMGIIRSINYSLRRDVLVWITVFSMIALPFLLIMIVCNVAGIEFSMFTPSFYFAYQYMAIVSVMFLMAIIILSCKVMGSDAADKTINYELLYGHKRDKVFAARVITGYMWGALLILLCVLLPLGYLTLFNGWGLQTNAKDVLIRTLLSTFPIIRICSLNMMYACLTKSTGKGIALGYATDVVVTIISTVLEELTEIKIRYGFGVMNLASILVSENSREFVIGGKPVMVYETAVTTQMAVKTICFSLIFSVIYISIAYMAFKKGDRD